MYETTYLEAEKLHQNNSVNTIRPSVVMTEITSIVCDMLDENIEFVKRNGMTERAKQSRIRLLKLLDITETVNSITLTNESLRLYNNELFSENCRLKSENSQLAERLEITNKTFDEL